ncbi:MAG: autotransporter assembly complex family protein [Pseudomonadota bacterium]
MKSSQYGALLALALMLSACAGEDADEIFTLPFSEPETAVAYEVEIEGAPSEDIAALIQASLALTRRQERGAQSLAFLRRRARDDVQTVQKILRSRGYYEGEVEVEIDPRGLDGEPPPEDATALARLVIEPGRQFTLARHAFRLGESTATPPDAAALGSPVGGPAEAAPITEAETAAVTALRRSGYPYAEQAGRDAVADLDAAEIEVDTALDTGARYVFGPLSFTGNPDVDEAFLRTYLTWEEGAVFDISRLSAYQNRLIDTGLFAAANVSPPATPPEGEAAPIAVRLEQAKFRTISAGARFSTDAGPGVRLSFEHRNLFGAGERFSATLDTELEEQEFALAFSKPQFLLRDGQTLDAEIRSFRAEDSPFDAIGVTAALGIRRRLGENWTVGAGLLGEFAVIDEPPDEPTALIAGVPVFAQYDSTDDLLNATQGQRVRLGATPFAGTFDDETTAFLTLEGLASAYQDLTGSGRFVLAERLFLGTTVGENVEDVPQTRRFYSGGGGSVRGFERYLIGALQSDNDPIGGLSVAEAALEIRFPIFGDIGGVAFFDAGTVSQESGFVFNDDLLVAAGTGVRYYSPIGPIRLDIAFPLNGRDVDDPFQFYFSIGQAF